LIVVSTEKPPEQAVGFDVLRTQPDMLSASSKTEPTTPVVDTVVYPAVPTLPCGVLHPVGTVSEIPPLFIDSAAVKIKVSMFAVELTRVVSGDVETVAVPEPSAAYAKLGTVTSEARTSTRAR
jgi:hypothetical protein